MDCQRGCGVEGLDELVRMAPAELEALFREERPLAVPRGVFSGKLLCWLDSPESRHALFRPVTAAMFEHAPFGVDFDARCWFFWSRWLRAGRFAPVEGPSRWRPTRVIGLRYHGSRLPGPVKALLYDEVKPLSDRLCLGIGGLDLTGEPGEMFFFGLERS